MSLGIEFSESPCCDFIESPLCERGDTRQVGIYAVFIDQIVGTAINPSNEAVMDVVEGVIDILRAASFPLLPGVRWIRSLGGGSDTTFEWEGPAINIGGSDYRAQAVNRNTSAPYGLIYQVSNGLQRAFINPCAPGIRVDRLFQTVQVQASKTLLVFGGQNGAGSAIGFCVPRPSAGRVCVYDSVRARIGGSYVIESSCSIEELEAGGGGAGRVDVGRRVTIGPPGRDNGSLNLTTVINDGNTPTPQWIRRMYAPDIPVVLTGGDGNWPPVTPASCCNLA